MKNARNHIGVIVTDIRATRDLLRLGVTSAEYVKTVSGRTELFAVIDGHHSHADNLPSRCWGTLDAMAKSERLA